MRALGKLGDPVRVSVKALVRPTYRVEWEYDGQEAHWTDDGREDGPAPRRKVQVRSFLSWSAAYLWIARKLIFERRDQYQTGEAHYENGRRSCSLCDAIGPTVAHGELVDPGLCRYHETKSFQALAKRLARWLRWRDDRRSALAAEQASAKGDPSR